VNRYLEKDICGIGDPMSPIAKIVDIEERKAQHEALLYACRFWIEHLVDSDQEQFLDHVAYMLLLVWLWLCAAIPTTSLLDRTRESILVDILNWMHASTRRQQLLPRVQMFLIHKLLYWIEALSLLNQVQVAVPCLRRLEEWMKVLSIHMILLICDSQSFPSVSCVERC
jgi:hypothetical protein